MSLGRMNPQPHDSVSDKKDDGESLVWFVRLTEGHPERIVVIALCALMVGAVGFFVFHQPVLAVLGFCAIVGSTGEFWLGIHYALDSKGVSARCGFSLTSMEWDQVKRVTISGNLIRVSPLAEMTSLEPFRGVLLRTLPEERDHVLEFVRTKCKEDVRILGGGTSGSGSGSVNRESGERNQAASHGDAGDPRD